MTPFSEPIYITRPLLPDISKLLTKIQNIWETKQLTNGGSQHFALENKVREYLGVPQLSLFNNGTIALITAVQSLRLTGEVITTPFTFPATSHVLTWNNIRPIFCDIDPVTMNIDPKKIESMITPQTTGILPVHVYGTPCDVEAIQNIADRFGLKVIYDAAHAFGTEIGGTGIGNFGDITMFSFHATKLFHTAEGGALTYRDPNFKARIDFLKNFGIKNEDEVVMPGINGKMNEIQAALGITVLDCVEEERTKRQKIVNMYIQRLSAIPGISPMPEQKNFRSSLQYFVVRINEEKFGKHRDLLYSELRKYNVFARKYFFPLCSDYQCYSQLPSANKNNLPVAQKVVQEVLCLPLYGDLLIDEVLKICDIIEHIRKQ